MSESDLLVSYMAGFEDGKKSVKPDAMLDDVRELVRLYDSLIGNEILRHVCQNEYQLHEYNKFKFLFEKVRAHVV